MFCFIKTTGLLTWKNSLVKIKKLENPGCKTFLLLSLRFSFLLLLSEAMVLSSVSWAIFPSFQFTSFRNFRFQKWKSRFLLFLWKVKLKILLISTGGFHPKKPFQFLLFQLIFHLSLVSKTFKNFLPLLLCLLLSSTSYSTF